MGASQIYGVVNTIANNISYTGSAVVDTSSFLVFGASALSSPAMTESVYNQLYDLIGKTVIAIDEAEDDERNIVVDAFEYGSILAKYSYQNQASEVSSEWDIMNPENPYIETRKAGIIQTFFEQTIPTFSWKDVSYKTQLQEAFHSPEELAGWTDGLYTRMRNAYRIAKNGLSDSAIGGLMCNIYADSNNVNYGRRVRHLLTEYNRDYGASLTSTNSYGNSNYLDYVRKVLTIDKANLNKMTKLYNDGTVERRTPDENVRLDISVEATASYAKFYGDTYNENYIQLPKHNVIVNWGIATSPAEVKYDWNHSGTTVDIENVLAFMYDKDSVVATMDRSRFVSIYDSWNDRNVFKLTANRRYIADPSENAVIYLND